MPLCPAELVFSEVHRAENNAQRVMLPNIWLTVPYYLN